MNILSTFLFRPSLRIKFDDTLDNYTVIKENSGILYVGSKDKCRIFMQSHMFA